MVVNQKLAAVSPSPVRGLFARGWCTRQGRRRVRQFVMRFAVWPPSVSAHVRRCLGSLAFLKKERLSLSLCLCTLCDARHETRPCAVPTPGRGGKHGSVNWGKKPRATRNIRDSEKSEMKARTKTTKKLKINGLYINGATKLAVKTATLSLIS